MKKNIPLLAISLLFFVTADAQAEEQCVEECCCVDRMNFYAKAFGGANFLQSTTIDGNKASYETGYIVSGALGFCWRCYGLRVEAEYAYRKNDISKIHFVSQGSSTNGHFQTSSYMGNLLWDIPCSFWKINPFIGAGVGYDFEHMFSSNSLIEFSQEWGRVSWQAMAGFVRPISRNIDISLEYRFHQGGHFYNNAVGVGLAYKFGFIR